MRKLGFGKFKGKLISECPSYYVRWLMLNARSIEIKQAARDEWTRRETWGGHWLKPRIQKFS